MMDHYVDVLDTIAFYYNAGEDISEKFIYCSPALKEWLEEYATDNIIDEKSFHFRHGYILSKDLYAIFLLRFVS